MDATPISMPSPTSCSATSIAIPTAFERPPDCVRIPEVAEAGIRRIPNALDAWLNVPENAQELVGAGTPMIPRPKDDPKRRVSRLDEFGRQKLMEYVTASYEVVPLLAEYSPRINAQQLKNALISREERDRVEKLIGAREALALQSVRCCSAWQAAAAPSGQEAGVSCVTFSATTVTCGDWNAQRGAGQRQPGRQRENPPALGDEWNALRVPVAG